MDKLLCGLCDKLIAINTQTAGILLSLINSKHNGFIMKYRDNRPAYDAKKNGLTE